MQFLLNHFASDMAMKTLTEIRIDFSNPVRKKVSFQARFLVVPAQNKDDCTRRIMRLEELHLQQDFRLLTTDTKVRNALHDSRQFS